MRRAAWAACTLLLGAAVAGGGCAPAGAPRPTPAHLAPPRAWEFQAAEHVALWYHALAHTGSVAEAAAFTLPLHDTLYVREIAAARRAAGVAATPLEQRADEFATSFGAATAFRNLEFLPLYFDNTAALLEGIRVWNQVGGDPRRAGNPETAAAVALLSSMFPQAAQRSRVVEWRDVLASEHSAFFQSWWAGRQTALQRLAAEAAAVWAPLATPLQPLLASLGLQGGDVFLVPSLGPEGRLLPQGAGRPRIAVEAPGIAGAATAGPAGIPAAQQVVFSFIHELAYPLAWETIEEHVAPARQRELGQERLAQHAAVQAGALALDIVAPADAAPYRRYFLHGAGHRVAAGAAQAGVEFDRVFYLPPELVAGLKGAVEQALAGI